MKFRSGAKYEFVMYSVLRAAAIDSAKKRSAAVLPSVGADTAIRRPLPRPAASRGCAAGEHHPVASTHAAANAD